MALSAIVLVALPLGAAARDGYTRNVANVLYNGAEILDWAGPKPRCSRRPVTRR